MVAGLWRAYSRTHCFPRPMLPPVTRMTFPSREGMSVDGVKDTMVRSW